MQVDVRVSLTAKLAGSRSEVDIDPAPATGLMKGPDQRCGLVCVEFGGCASSQGQTDGKDYETAHCGNPCMA